MKTPTEIHLELSEERVCAVANVMRERRHACVINHLAHEGDDGWVLGSRCWQWIRARLIKLADGEYKDWLSIVENGKGGSHFVFAIGGVPIRFYRGDPEDVPPKQIECNQAEDLAMQIAFSFSERKKKREKVETHIRIAVDTDENGEAADITLIQVDEDLNLVGDGWVIPKEPLKIKRFLKREEGKDLGKPPIGSRKPKKEHGEE